MIERAASERRLPGGSLVAAANCMWCAESAVLYDMCETASRDGLVDLPTMIARRGGIKWPVRPTFKQIYDGTAKLGFRFRGTGRRRARRRRAWRCPACRSPRRGCRCRGCASPCRCW
ncbi:MULTISPECIES: major capsid protein [Actinomadura]|uniref:Major capsid protein n=1 Tax=Actinomadura yumaensis TaxID=111807 RepID=A0ABW2CID6_9ACTN|nr:major capsid protein [Actinomadura sp. J1-007]